MYIEPVLISILELTKLNLTSEIQSLLKKMKCNYDLSTKITSTHNPKITQLKSQLNNSEIERREEKLSYD